MVCREAIHAIILIHNKDLSLVKYRMENITENRPFLFYEHVKFFSLCMIVLSYLVETMAIVLQPIYCGTAHVTTPRGRSFHHCNPGQKYNKEFFSELKALFCLLQYMYNVPGTIANDRDY